MMIKLVAFDMDGTIVKYPVPPWYASWDALGRAAGKHEQFESRLKKYLPQMETSSDPAKIYARWVNEDSASLAGIPFSQVEPFLFPIPYIDGFKEFCAYLKEEKIITGIISGGVGFVARKIQEENGLDFLIANEPEIENGTFTGRGKMNVALSDIHQRYNKHAHMTKVLGEYKINPSDAAFVGDSFTDLPAWLVSGTRIAINPKHYDQWKHKIDDLQIFEDFNAVLSWFKSIHVR